LKYNDVLSVMEMVLLRVKSSLW